MKKLSKIFLSLWILLFFISTSFAKDRDLPWITIITREDRWADETIRLTSYSKRQSVLANRAVNQKALEELRATNYSAYLKKVAESDKANEKKNIANNYLIKNYYSDMYTDRSNNKYNWQSIRWTEYHRNKKTKIIIHHTASDNTTIKTQQDAIDYIKYVYKYHTLNNARWDIWYNFIIDPFGNIYEGRAGWEWVIWAHAKRNNTASVWIAMIWNFEEVQPTKEAMDSLIRLTAALVKKYNINPNWTTYYHKDSSTTPYVQSNKNYTIAWHRDAWTTACPWTNLYKLLPYIRTSVTQILNWESRTLSESLWLPSYEVATIKTATTIIPKATKTTTQKLTYQYFETQQTKIAPAIKQIKNDYISKNNVTPATKFQDKIIWNITINQEMEYLKNNIKVLLYELTQNYNEFMLSCDWWCTFKFDNNTINWDNCEITQWIWDSLALTIGNNTYTTQNIIVSSKNNVITIENYNRKSYAWIPRNTFHWDLIFQKDYIMDKKWNQAYKYVVINDLKFTDYMKWIVETNDTETQTKNDVMSLVSKSYALFYMDPANQHPNIPNKASYSAVDDSDIFQKYVWAGLEKTLKKRYTALSKTENKLLTYNWIVPILPYFSCSAWFTYTAYEKRWWKDTPYLQTRFDLWICTNKKFSWHWVWLSWLWAERRAKNFWWSYSDILKYYYPWIEIVNL